MKIEPPPRRELNFEGPGPSKCHLFVSWNPFQKLDRFWRLIARGVGGPPGKPERTSEPTSFLQNAYRDWHRDATQKDNPCRRSGSKARSCREKALSLIKSSKHNRWAQGIRRISLPMVPEVLEIHMISQSVPVSRRCLPIVVMIQCLCNVG